MARVQPPERSREEEAQVLRFKQLTEVALPELACEQRWPIRFDHCFKRICLDYAFEDAWFKHLPRPAERHLRGEALTRATRCAAELLEQGLPLLRERDGESLRFRGKRRATNPACSAS
jgi:hypothetical protein